MSVSRVAFVVHHAGDVDLGALFATYPVSATRSARVLVVGEAGRRPWWHRLPAVGSSVVGDLRTAVGRAAGADVLWFVDARSRVHREAWARTLRRVEEDADVVHARASLHTSDGPVRSARGLLATDLAVGAPCFAVVRTAAIDAGDVLGSWSRVVASDPGRIERSHPVELLVSRGRGPLPPLQRLAAGEEDVGGARPTVGWIGFAGNENLGDEAVVAAASRLLPDVDVLPDREGTHGTVLGGGTLLNTKRFYQRVADDLDAPGLPRVVLGTGVVSPTVRGFTEELGPWRPFLEAGPVGLRGPDSVEHLRAWGWEGPVEVLGDPALALSLDDPPPRHDDLVVVAPVGSSAVGQVEDDDEHGQVALLAAAVARWQGEGRTVELLLAHPGDARVGRLLAQKGVELDALEGWRDLHGSLTLLGRAGLVVGTRLHALVLAAAVDTPFVGLAYRPKLQDFARSVDADESTRPIREWDAAALVAAAAAVVTPPRRERVGSRVRLLRGRLAERAAGFAEQVRALSP